MHGGRRRRARGYAAPLVTRLATVVASGLALTACGSEQAALVNAPTTAPTTTAAAVTAPPASDTATDAPLFVAPSTTGVAAGPTVEVTALSAPAAAAPTRATASPKATPSAPSAPSGPRIVPALIPYPATRLAEMAAYSLRHSGSATAHLDPTVIVLHYTAGGTWSSTRNSFAADVANLGELPNVCAHFVVDQDGTVYQLVPTSVRCRHTIGLNDVAIGIEMVQAAGSGPTWADQQILDRSAQVDAALALVRSLQAQYGIGTSNVIGHAMANAAPQFHDLLGWHNDHGDWQSADVAVFRSRL
ncbi:MAG: peptidoglycan recognition family protein [Lapillicoccus sp.]